LSERDDQERSAHEWHGHERADRYDYDDLPEPTRRFIEALRPGEIELLEESINFMRSAKTMGKFARWTMLLIVGTFVTIAGFGDALIKVMTWIRGASQ
jgi:hypothetical protein